MKLGQEIRFKEGFEVTSEITGNKLMVMKNDSAIVTKRGLKVINGEARGKILDFNKDEIKGVDYKNIAKLIYQRLNNEYDISEFLMDYEISKEEILDSIIDVLSCIM